MESGASLIVRLPAPEFPRLPDEPAPGLSGHAGESAYDHEQPERKWNRNEDKNPLCQPDVRQFQLLIR